jgi:hypothetical protein
MPPTEQGCYGAFDKDVLQRLDETWCTAGQLRRRRHAGSGLEIAMALGRLWKGGAIEKRATNIGLKQRNGADATCTSCSTDAGRSERRYRSLQFRNAGHKFGLTRMEDNESAALMVTGRCVPQRSCRRQHS